MYVDGNRIGELTEVLRAKYSCRLDERYALLKVLRFFDGQFDWGVIDQGTSQRAQSVVDPITCSCERARFDHQVSLDTWL